MEDGHAALRTRADGSIELRINGVFVMDDQEIESERRLARTALSQAHHASTVVGGGLRPPDRLTIWSQADSEPLRATLAESFAEVRSERAEVSLQQRAEAYWLLHATGPRGTTIMSSHER